MQNVPIIQHYQYSGESAMADPDKAVVDAAASISTMGDKVVAFAVTQDLLWTFAALKGDLSRWTTARPYWFLGGALASGVIYALVELFLWWNQRGIVKLSGYDSHTERLIAKSIDIHYSMLSLGVIASSALAGLAFWGTSKGV